MYIVGWLAIKWCGFHHHLYRASRQQNVGVPKGSQGPCQLLSGQSAGWLCAAASVASLNTFDEFPQNNQNRTVRNFGIFHVHNYFHIRSTSKNSRNGNKVCTSWEMQGNRRSICASLSKFNAYSVLCCGVPQWPFHYNIMIDPGNFWSHSSRGSTHGRQGADGYALYIWYNDNIIYIYIT